MEVTREIVARRLEAYLQHRLTLAELVDWAEGIMMEGEIESGHHAVVRDALARLGLADVRAFGLNWEDCEELLERLGYKARVEVSTT